MGERSKKIGEKGEEIVGEFLRMIGWTAAQDGVVVPCVKPETHKTTESDRTTHGIDFLSAYPSPLIDGVGINLVVSVKFSASPYPPNPTALFKKHFTDLAHTLECFKNSEVRRKNSQILRGTTKTQDIGVLLWINNDRNGNGDVIGQLHSVKLPDTFNYEAIYLVDNKRAQFIFDTINFAKQIAKGDSVTFFYAATGKNVNPRSKTNHGSLLPVEYINSSVLALRVANDATRKRGLILSTLETFSETNLKRLLGLAQNLSQDWCGKVILAFPDYDALNHGNILQSAKGCFSSESGLADVEVYAYTDDFRDLTN